MPTDLSLLNAFSISFEAIFKLFLIAFVGFVFVRKGYISDDGINGLTRLMIDVIVPCALGISMIKGFRVELLEEYSSLLLFPALWIPLSAVMALGFFRLWRGKNPAQDRAATALAAVQNSFYIPLPIVLAILHPDLHALAIVLIGISVLPVSPLQWTLGTWLVMGEKAAAARDWKMSFFHTLNLPVLGIIGGALLSLLPPFVSAAQGDPESFLPLRLVLSAMGMIGTAMGPMAMIILGALIARCTIGKGMSIRLLIPVVLIRFGIVPGIMYWLLSIGFIPAAPLLAFVLMLEAAAPSAMNLALAAKRYGGEWETISSLLLVVNLIGVLVLPFWMALGLRLEN